MTNTERTQFIREASVHLMGHMLSDADRSQAIGFESRVDVCGKAKYALEAATALAWYVLAQEKDEEDGR
jgi:hypothetical protein